MIVIGYWSGYDVHVNICGSLYNIRVQEGVRGIKVPVHVTYKPNLDSWQVYYKSSPLTIEEVLPL